MFDTVDYLESTYTGRLELLIYPYPSQLKLLVAIQQTVTILLYQYVVLHVPGCCTKWQEEFKSFLKGENIISFKDLDIADYVYAIRKRNYL